MSLACVFLISVPVMAQTPTPTPTPEDWFCFLELGYSSYLGGGGGDYLYDLTADSAGCLYLAGSSASSDFPTRGAYQASRADFDDVFVCKLSSAASALIYSTYLGGSGSETAAAVCLDSLGRAHITGATDSRNFPTLQSYQSSFAGGLLDNDAFAAGLSSSGSALIYSSYLGGTDWDQGKGIAIDCAGRAHLVGYTHSKDFPTFNPYQSSRSGISNDVFLSIFSSGGSALVYSTYLGGSDDDEGYGIAMNSSAVIYLTGKTISPNFPTAGPYQASRAGDSDAFVTAFSAEGSGLLLSSYLGGSWDDNSRRIDIDADGYIYIAGWTESSDFPIENAYQTAYSRYNEIFITRFDASGSSLVYSTYLGGSGNDYCYGLALDEAHAAHITGSTTSIDFPAASSYQSTRSGSEAAFAVKLSAGGSSLYYSTYLGGAGADCGRGIAVTSGGEAYLGGYTSSSDFPLSNPYQAVFGGEFDCFLSRPREICYLRPHQILESGDYDGDGTSDTAVFRPATGLWAVRGITRVYFGSCEDTPVCGDYDGDGTSEIAIFRKSSGLWAIRALTRTYFGSATDLPVPADYTGAGSAAPAVFRPGTGLWAVRMITRIYFGFGQDLPVPGDYGDSGSSDYAVFRPGTGLWAIRGLSRFYFGSGKDVLIPGDFEESSPVRAALFRPPTGLWAVREITRDYFGGISDRAVPADYDGEGEVEIGIFRPNTGLWAVKGLTKFYYGSRGDIPVTR